MKNRCFIKSIVLMMALVIFSSSISHTVFAESIQNEDDNSVVTYIEDVLPNYLEIHNVDMDNIYISNSFNVYNADINQNTDIDTYVVFKEDKVIGLFSINEINENYYSSFEYNNFDSIQEVYDNNEEIAFVSSDESLLIESELELYTVDECKTIYNTEIKVDELYRIEKAQEIEAEDNILEISSSYYYKKNIAVPIVANATSPNNEGLCWAATIASKYDYESNQNLTAIDVYNNLAQEYGGNPIGTVTWVQRGFSYYSMDCTTLYRMMDCGEILENIKADNTIYMSLTDGSVGHAVLMCGITFNNDESGIYRIMDSNRSTYVDVAVSEETMNGESQFVYATNYGYTFNNWRRSFY